MPGGPGGYGQGVVAADVDGDGWSDLFLTNYGADALLLNRGDGMFEDATARWQAGVGAWSASASFADADGDGDLDLYVSRYLAFDPNDPIYCGDAEAGTREFCGPDLFDGEGDVFLRNEGGQFSDQTASAGFGTATGKALGVLFADFDGDGAPDVYVANDLTPNLLFHNRGNGTFEDVSLISGAAMNSEGREEAGMGVALGDTTGDGLPEIVVSNYDVETNTLYRNLGSMLFEDVSAASGIGVPSFNLLGFGMTMADFDRDGVLDLYVANGHVRERPERDNVGYAQRDLLLLGRGEGRFQEVRCDWLEAEPKVGRGLAVADYDSDGDVDLAVQNSGGPFDLLRNDQADGSWIGLTLHGAGANSAAIGARVVVETSDGSRQSRWVQAGDSYLSSSDARALFGLGDRKVERVEVLWPSGARTVVESPTSTAICTCASLRHSQQTSMAGMAV